MNGGRCKVMSFGAPLTNKVPGGLAEARRRSRFVQWEGVSGPSAETHHRTPNGSCGAWHSRSPWGASTPLTAGSTECGAWVFDVVKQRLIDEAKPSS